MRKIRITFCMILLCVIIPAFFAVSVDANSDINLEAIVHTKEVKSIGAEIVSFDISSQGDILLLFLPETGQSNHGFINIYDSLGTAKESIELSSNSSGTLRAWFDNDTILVYYLRDDAAFCYSSETKTISKTDNYIDCSEKTNVLPITQKSTKKHVFENVIYELHSPGIIDALLYGNGYAITAEHNGTSTQIWQDGGTNIRSKIARGIVVIVLVLMLMKLLYRLMSFKLNSKKGQSTRILVLYILPCVLIWGLLVVLNNNVATISWSLAVIWSLLCLLIFVILVGIIFDIKRYSKKALD